MPGTPTRTCRTSCNWTDSRPCSDSAKQRTEQEEGPTYLAVWEVDGDVEAARRALAQRTPAVPQPGSYDPARTSIRFYSAITDSIGKGDVAGGDGIAAESADGAVDASVSSR